MTSLRHALLLAGAILASALGVSLSSQPRQTREPASRAAVVLTWNQAQREAGFAGMETIFLTRTVRASDRPRPLPDGRPLPFAPGGPRAGEFDRFVTEQKVAGVLVLHDGAVRLERYALTGGRQVRWHSFSVAKSITSTLVGAAMKDGSIKSLDDPVTRYITDLRGSAYDEVTVRQLLTMTSGVRWNEDYTDLKSDVARMYAEPPAPGLDMTVSYVRKLPREAPPGTRWVYKTSETNLVGVLVMAATGKPLADYLSEKIWRPYGMERDAEWMLDDIGHEQGGCCLAMTLRDLGRFGLFILDGARIGNASVVTRHLACRGHARAGIDGRRRIRLRLPVVGAPRRRFRRPRDLRADPAHRSQAPPGHRDQQRGGTADGPGPGTGAAGLHRRGEGRDRSREAVKPAWTQPRRDRRFHAIMGAHHGARPRRSTWESGRSR